MPHPDPTWTLADLVDFEILIAQDSARDTDLAPQTIEQRDRRIARQIHAAPRAKTSPEPKRDRRHLFREWLRYRLEDLSSDGGVTPGAATVLALSFSSLTLALGGFLSGKGVLWVVLTGAGLGSGQGEPVNVLFFLLTCVVPQIVFALAAALLLLTHGSVRIPSPPPVVRGLFTLVIRPLFGWFVKRVQLGMRAERRQELARAIGLLKSQTVSHAGALRWPIIGLLHWFAVGYAAAIVLGVFLSVQIWHQTFAWQTTVAAYTPDRVHRVMETIASPWAWALPEGTGYPTRDDIAATRFHRHQDPAELPAHATGSWWVFVVMSALVYGFLPRFLLLLFSRWKLKRALARESFDTLRLDSLYERLTHPHVNWHANTPADAIQTKSTTDVDLSTTAEPRASPGPAILFIPSDLDTPPTRAAINQRLAAWRGWDIQETVQLDGTAAGTRAALERLRQHPESVITNRICILREAFMPPTRELLDFLRNLRLASAPSIRILVSLIGKPSTQPLGHPASPLDCGVWKRQIQSLGDPNLEVLPLPPS